MDDIDNIHETIEWSRRQLEKRCRERTDAVKQFVGSHYSDNGSSKVVPVNMLELATTIYLRLLAAHEPKCLVTTEDYNLRPFANDLEIVLNKVPREINLKDTIRRAVMEAMFSIGVVKVGLADTNPNPRIGDEPFVSVVQMDDYFCDMAARNWDEIQYEGNEYWMTTDDVEKMFGKKITPDEYHGDTSTGVEDANKVTSGESRRMLHEKVRLRDVYLTRSNEMVTYAVHGKTELRRVKWDGPEGTPYIKLWFTSVPGNLMPLAPVMLWRDLHDLGNHIYRKLANQATNKKTVAVFQGGSDDAVERFKRAKDGEAVNYNGATPQEITVGGVDNTNLAFFLSTWDRYSMLCGNLDSLGGLSATSSTAKQDSLISDAASARIKDMGDKTVEFAKEIFKRLAWYVWTDPVRVRRFTKFEIPEAGISLRKEWTPETRDGDFLDYNFDIAVFSMQDDSPSARMQKFMEVFQSLVMPMQQQLEAQGAYIDFGEVMRYVSRNANMPELNDMVKFRSADQMPQDGSAMGQNPRPEYVSTKAPVTERRYIREGRGGGTRQGRDAAMAQILMGAGVQDAQMAQTVGGIR